MLISIVSAAIILGLLIVIHELGHFFMAKQLGVRVIRFSIGYPPKLWGVRRGETEYAIGGTPLGGYVRMLGDEVGEEPKPEEVQTYLHEITLDIIEAARQRGLALPKGKPEEKLEVIARRLSSTGLDAGAADDRLALAQASATSFPAAVAQPETEPSQLQLSPEQAILLGEVQRRGSAAEAVKAVTANPPAAIIQSFTQRAFPTQRLWKRVLIVLAGPLANVVFGPILLLVVLMYGVPVLLPVVGQVKPGLPADRAGLRTGDRIVLFDGETVYTWVDFSTAVKATGGRPITLEIERTSGFGAVERKKVTIQPTREEQKSVYGTPVEAWIIGVLPRGDEAVRRLGPIQAAGEAVTSSVQLMGELVVGIASIVSGATPVREALGGPIMIAQLAGREAHRGFANIAMFTVMLSLELGLINLLPVPLLDGGHLLFFAFEGIRGEPLEVRTREMALQVGLFLLVALMAFVIFNDISRIVQG
jgi:regulator of sigma E protease